MTGTGATIGVQPTLSSSENPYCYVPTDQIGLAIFKWEMKQQGVGVR